MADTAPKNISTSDGFPASIVDFYISKKIQDHGVSTYRFREAAEKNTLPAGNGTNIKFIRYNRLVVPTALTEGVEPAGDELEVETITGTCEQLGQVVKISDVLELTMWHPVVRRAMDELAEAAARKDDALIQEVLLGAANAELPNDVTSRADIPLAVVAEPPTGVINTTMLRKALSTLEVGAANTFDGGAKPYSDGLFKGIIHRKHMLDLMDDSTWRDMAVRQDKGALERGELLLWNRTKFQATNFGPQFTQIDYDDSVANDVVAPSTAPADPGGIPNGLYNWAITATNKRTGFEDTICDLTAASTPASNAPRDSTIASGDTASGNIVVNLDVAGAVDTNFTYKFYLAAAVGADEPPRFADDIVVSDAGVSTDLTVSTLPAETATAAPQGPSTGVTVLTSYVLGADSYSVVDLSSLKTFMVKGASKSDPLDQQRTMGTKWFDTALILNDAFLVRLEAASQY